MSVLMPSCLCSLILALRSSFEELFRYCVSCSWMVFMRAFASIVQHNAQRKAEPRAPRIKYLLLILFCQETVCRATDKGQVHIVCRSRLRVVSILAQAARFAKALYSPFAAMGFGDFAGPCEASDL